MAVTRNIRSTVFTVDNYGFNRRINPTSRIGVDQCPNHEGIKGINRKMPRPKHKQPTPGELEVLKILWDRGASTVREVWDVLNARRERAYTSVMSLLNVMHEKGLLSRQPHGRAYLYRADIPQTKALKNMVGDLLSRAFEGSASSMVAHLLDQSEPSDEELLAIRETINQHLNKHEAN